MTTLNWSALIPLTYEEIQKIPIYSGIYRLSYAPGDGNFFIFYIGKADNLRKRLIEHIGNTEENVCIKNYIRTYPCYVRFAEVQNSQERAGAERQLFLKFRPKCNLQEPEGPAIEINFE